VEQLHSVVNFYDLSSWFIDAWLPTLDPFSQKSHAVLLPCAVAIENLKIACVQSGVSVKNVHFFTPLGLKSFLREFLDFHISEHENFYIFSEKTLKFWLQNILRPDTKQRSL
jgi:hypothetical protein